jgi:ribosomal protein L37E
MAQLVRCKSCGYVTAQSRVKDVCPACGVPAKNMLPYTDPVSAKRRRILALDIHPVVDHFSVAFSASTLVLAVAGLFVPGRLDSYLFDTLITLSIFTPLGVIASFGTGLFDGKVRFRRVTTPVLVKKMILGIFFFVFSVLMLIIALLPGFPGPTLLEVYIVFNVGAFICSFFLGLLGSGLTDAELPG